MLRTSSRQERTGWLLACALAAATLLPAGLLRGEEAVTYPSTEFATAYYPLEEMAQGRELPLFDEAVTPTACYGEGCPSTQHYYDNSWEWGCAGSPFRTGPGNCDTWRVGPVWDVAVDGAVFFRNDTNLAALEAAANVNLAGNPIGPAQFTEQFDYSPGARASFTGKIPKYVGYRLQFAYEGVEEWNAAVIFPKVPPAIPPPDIGGVAEQSQLHYRTSWHSAEMNVQRNYRSVIWPFFGARFMRIDDELNCLIDQEVSPPLPAPGGAGPVDATDQSNIFDIKNDLLGFQAGIRQDLWQLNRWFSVQSFACGGVYLNDAKQTNRMQTTTTQYFADDVTTLDFVEERVDVSNAEAVASIERTRVTYMAEFSLTGVCRLNKCWALRGGYQALWLSGVYMADEAFLNTGMVADDLFMHGWHFGAEYRR